jgi:hypothetical protein
MGGMNMSGMNMPGMDMGSTSAMGSPVSLEAQLPRLYDSPTAASGCDEERVAE